MKSTISPGVNPAPMEDDASGAQATIDIAHHEIHEGDSFVAWHYGTGKNDGDTIIVAFKAPNTTKRIHVFPQAFSSGQAYFRILAGPTFTDNTGSAKTIFNRDRNSATAPTVIDAVANPNVAGQARTDPTGLAGGTEIYRELMGGSSPRTSGLSRNTDEFVVKQNTLYAFIVESDAAGLSLNLVLNWYEL